MAATGKVVIDRSDEIERYRFVCPRRHTTWDRTNNHIWCPSCRREDEHSNEDVDPEHYYIYDKAEDRKIPWEDVVLSEDLSE